MKLSTFAKSSNIPESLIRATVKQFGDWESFQESAEDIQRGADGGFSGFTYYTDTVKFAKAHKADILAFAGDMASDLGEDSAVSLIASFNCLKMRPDEVAEAIYNPRSEESTNVYNALAWFALEEVARAYTDKVQS